MREGALPLHAESHREDGAAPTPVWRGTGQKPTLTEFHARDVLGESSFRQCGTFSEYDQPGAPRKNGKKDLEGTPIRGRCKLGKWNQGGGKTPAQLRHQ